MHEIPIFDSLTHPTITGDWIEPKYNHRCHANYLRSQMKDAGVTRAFAVGMDIGGYDESSYADWVRTNIPNAYPVAYIVPHELTNPATLEQKFQQLRELGYVGIKLHPRRGQFRINSRTLHQIIHYAGKAGLLSFLCTYCVSDGSSHLSGVIDLAKKCPNSKIILLHGGLSEILNWSEQLRAFPNTLLDLSFTMLRYKGSSLDLDIKWLIRNFDKRICIGSDHPQYTLTELRAFFSELSTNIDSEKLLNVAYLNLNNLLEK